MATSGPVSELVVNSGGVIQCRNTNVHLSVEDETVPVISRLSKRTEHISTTTTTTTAVGSGKWCQSQQLSVLISTLAVMVIFHVMLLVWIVQVLDFSLFAIDQNKFGAIRTRTKDVPHLFGSVLVKDSMQTASIVAPKNRPLNIWSSNGITLGFTEPFDVRHSSNQELSQLHTSIHLESDNEPRRRHMIVAYATNFIVRSSANDNLLLLLQSSALNHQNNEAFSGESKVLSTEGVKAMLGVDSVQFNGKSGLRNVGSIQTSLLTTGTSSSSSSAHGSLSLSSSNRKVLLRGVKGVLVGDIPSTDRVDLISNRIVHVTSRAKEIVLSGGHNTSTLSFSTRLMTVHPTKLGRTYPTIGQVCICAASGKLFVAPNGVGQCSIVARVECLHQPKTSH